MDPQPCLPDMGRTKVCPTALRRTAGPKLCLPSYKIRSSTMRWGSLRKTKFLEKRDDGGDNDIWYKLTTSVGYPVPPMPRTFLSSMPQPPRTLTPKTTFGSIFCAVRLTQTDGSPSARCCVWALAKWRQTLISGNAKHRRSRPTAGETQTIERWYLQSRRGVGANKFALPYWQIRPRNRHFPHQG